MYTIFKYTFIYYIYRIYICIYIKLYTVLPDLFCLNFAQINLEKIIPCCFTQILNKMYFHMLFLFGNLDNRQHD